MFRKTTQHRSKFSFRKLANSKVSNTTIGNESHLYSITVSCTPPLTKLVPPIGPEIRSFAATILLQITQIHIKFHLPKTSILQIQEHNNGKRTALGSGNPPSLTKSTLPIIPTLMSRSRSSKSHNTNPHQKSNSQTTPHSKFRTPTTRTEPQAHRTSRFSLKPPPLTKRALPEPGHPLRQQCSFKSHTTRPLLEFPASSNAPLQIRHRNDAN